MLKMVFRFALIGALGMAALASPATAQPSAAPAAGAVQISYGEPRSPVHRPIFERLRQRRVLEDFRDFLAPLKLPGTLLVKTEDCKGMVNAWYSSRTITICYEYIEWIHEIARKVTISHDITLEDAIVGPFVDVLLHELAHAIIDMLRIPIFGREEDAADQLAAFILLQFGKDVARRTITGAALLFRQMAIDQKPGTMDFASVHGLPAQRFVNVLCIAYGAHRELFQDFVDKGLLPRHRIGHCYWEYQQIAYAFKTLISPHIDPQLQKEVQSREWLRSGDGR
jgi:hypothetical protein